MHWQVQEMKQRLSEVLRAAESDGVQYVTRHGKEVAVVMSMDDYQKLTGGARGRTFEEHLLAFPKSDEFAEIMDNIRDKSTMRDVDFGDE